MVVISTVSSTDTVAVLDAFLTVIPDKLAEGRIVELGDFGTFRISISSEGVANPEEVTAHIDLQNDADDFINRCASFNEMMRIGSQNDADDLVTGAASTILSEKITD